MIHKVCQNFFKNKFTKISIDIKKSMETRPLPPSGEARASGNYKFVSGSDFNHELAKISVIARAAKTDL